MVVKAVTTASGGVQSPPFFCVQFTGNDDPTPWPYRHTIRYKFMDDVPAVVQDILRSTIDEWLKSQPTPQIYVQRVETGDADVRFGLTASGVTLCALGKNVPDSQQQPTVLLGLRTWKADESEVVWTHSEMERMARHVWGHVLGLPHAPSEYSYEWKDAALNEVCSATGITKSQITQPRGNSKLDASDSVMHYDRPSELVASPVSYRERVGNVDSKAIRLLNELYPSPREFEVVHQWCSNMPGWKETWTEQKMLVREYTKNWSAGSRISALNYVDLGTNSYYQACVHAQPTDNPKVVTLNMGAYSTESHIVNLKASFLLWNTPDSGVQTGTEKTSDIRGSWWTTAQGEKFEKRIQFAQPFKSTPKVLNFIYAFCVEKGNWIRISVFPKDVSNTGFTMCLHSWADTMCHNISACWVAHEADDPTIRSGRWEPPEHWGPWATEDSATLEYYSPLSARPREIFCGFNHVNVRGGVNARFKCDALRWSERSVDMKISTWEQESAYHNMGASYIALL